LSFSDSVFRDVAFKRKLVSPLLKYGNVRIADILLKRVGKVIIVEYEGGNNLRGKLKRFDSHMNLLLEETREITTFGEVNSLGSVLLRGSNIVLILANIAEMVF
jgi:small nuclear ribonucleoprotein